MLQINDMNWRNWLKHGDQYLQAATPKGEKSRFGGDIRYNLLSMALESFIMAIVDYHNRLPENHTFTDLIDALEKVLPISQELKHRILKYENIQSICSIEKYHRTAPSEDDLDDLKKAIMEIGKLAHETCIEHGAEKKNAPGSVSKYNNGEKKIISITQTKGAPKSG